MPDDQPLGAGAGCPDSKVADRQAAPPQMHGAARSVDCEDGDDPVQQVRDRVPGVWGHKGDMIRRDSLFQGIIPLDWRDDVPYS